MIAIQVIGVARRSHLEDAAAMTFRRSKSIFRLLRALAGLSLAAGLAGCQLAVLQPTGSVGAAERLVLLDSLAIMLAIIVPTIVATLAFAWWFRASNAKAERLPTWAYSGRIELVTWSVPLLTIMFLGGIAWIGSHDLDPARPLSSDKRPLNVQVVSLDWKWLFIYPDQHVAAVNQLVVPVNTPIHFTLTSASVWDSFFVPGLGSMIYTMNGMTTQLNLLADRTGDFPGLSTHLSGDGFSDMNFVVHAVPADAFDGWWKAQRSGPKLDQAAYRELAKQSSAVPPMTYSAAEPGLFEAVVAQKLAPGPGPTGGTAPVSPKGGS